MKKAYETIPEGYCECPACNGSGREFASEHAKKYRNVIAGYDLSDDTIPCQNCGGSTMYGQAMGYMKAGKDGKGCIHSHKSTNIGRCLTRYTCVKCGSYYDIDSGD